MPVYDYRCRSCGYVWEVRLSGTAGNPEKCPSCNSKTIERLFPTPYIAKGISRAPGTTCCGRTERCETPPCSTGGSCQRK